MTFLLGKTLAMVLSTRQIFVQRERHLLCSLVHAGIHEWPEVGVSQATKSRGDVSMVWSGTILGTRPSLIDSKMTDISINRTLSYGWIKVRRGLAANVS